MLMMMMMEDVVVSTRRQRRQRQQYKKKNKNIMIVSSRARTVVLLAIIILILTLSSSCHLDHHHDDDGTRRLPVAVLLVHGFVVQQPSIRHHHQTNPASWLVVLRSTRNPVLTASQQKVNDEFTSTSSKGFIMKEQQQQQQDTNDTSSSGTGGETGGDASIPALTVNLIKSIVGSGVLALPASVAVLGNTPDVLLPASIIIICMCCLNAYFFTLIGRVCSMTGAIGYRDAWDKTIGLSTSVTSSVSSSSAGSASSSSSSSTTPTSSTTDSDSNTNNNSNNSSRLVAAVIVIKTGLSCLAYSMILADSFQSLAITAGMMDITRNQALQVVTALALVPLCLLQNLASLTPFSLLGVVGILFTVLSMIYRYLDGSYSTTSLLEPPEIDCIHSNSVPLDGMIMMMIPTTTTTMNLDDVTAMAAGPVSTLISFTDGGGAGLGDSVTAALTTSSTATAAAAAANMCSTATTATTTFLASTVAYIPPPTDVILSPDGIAVLVCTLATAFVAHYNAPRFFNELSNNTTPRFNSVVIMSYTISALLFIIVSATGFLTFGSISDGLILNNYSTQDSLMTLSRAAVALSLVFTYPLPFVGLRDGVLALAREFFSVNKDNNNNNDTSSSILSSSTSTLSAASGATIVKENKNDNDSFAVTTIISLVLLGAITLGAESISDLKLVLAVGGGTFSTAVASVFPALMFRSAMLQKHKRQDDDENNSNNNNSMTILTAAEDDAKRRRRQWESLEIKFVTALMGLSIAIGATGVYRALESAMQQ